jgi:hypothetical protein
MLSRVANSLYWMSRYIERAENVARIVDVNLQLFVDFRNLDDQRFADYWMPIVQSTGDESAFLQLYITYLPSAATVHTHMREVLLERRGVCQDFAHVMIGLCRSLKIPALYVSGYLATETASATHAWVEVFVPGFGWRGLDPTHNCQTDETYVKIAVGRDYADVPPLTGNYKGTLERKMEVEVKIWPVA